MAGSSVADLFIVLDSVTDPFSSGMKRAAADAEAQTSRMSSALGLVAKAGLGVGIAVTGIAAASVKAASDFQANMTKLSTAAGAPKAAVQAATGEILKLGTQVGMTGTQMAEALYHPVSAGLDMATSLQVVKYAAEEAQISGANLDDTTYSLSSVMKAFNYPAAQAAQTMAMLNAVVGDGDMRFQDFNVSIKNWAPTAAQMGISIQSMGAGLAYLTDRGNSAEEASTRLTMGLSMMATPSKQAASLLEGLGVASSDVKGSTDAMTQVLRQSGITQNQLAADLAKPDGLYVALNHLKTALENAGVKGTEADSAIAKIFGGGRSDKAILSLLQNLDGLKQKYDQIGTDATPTKFQDSWETTKNTFAFQMQQMKVAAENLGIDLGMKLLPVLSNVISQGESAFGQIAAGYTGAASKPLPHPGMGNALLNKDMATPPPLTGWQKFGSEFRTILTDVETDGKRLEPVAQDFIRFGEDVWQSLGKIEHVAAPVAHDLGVTLFAGAEAAGKVFANVLGPGIKDVADFIDGHQTMIRIFADVILGGLAVKMGVLGTINATKGLIDLATRIVQFPVGQVGEITTAWKGMTTAWTGKEAAEGEQAVQGLSGAFSDLKTKATGALDKMLPDSGKLAGLAKVGQDIGGIEKAAASSEQLALFETNLSGIVQVADHEQLSLFAADIGSVATEAQTAEASTGGLLAKIGGFAMAGGVIGGVLLGVGLLADQLGHLAGVGDHTAMNMDELNTKLQLAGSGSVTAQSDFTKTAVAMVAMSGAMGTMGMHAQGLTDVDTAMANLVKNGNVQQAKDEFNQIALTLQRQGIDATTTASKFPQYEQALKDAGDAAQTMGGKVQDALDKMQHQQALDQFTSDLGNLTQSIKDNGGALSGNTQQAQQNIDAFRTAALESLQFYQDQVNAHAPMDQVNRDLANQYNALESVATQFLGSKKKADDFLASLGMIKPQYDTTIGLNTDPAYKALHGLIQTINTSYGTVQVNVSQSGLGLGTNRGAGTPSMYDLGGWVNAPKGQPQPAIVHGGEYVLSLDQLAGRQQIDPRVLAGLGPRTGTTTVGYVPGQGAGATTVVNYYVTQNVQGSVLGRVELENLIVEVVQRRKLRNSSTGMT